MHFALPDNEENRRKHLEQIELVIVRLGANSFLLKGWSVTLVGAILALATVDPARREFAFLALLPSIVFWGLDAYYLHQERLFRCLYDGVRLAPPNSLDGGVFSMSTKAYRSEAKPLWRVCITPVLLLFHGAIVSSVIVGALVLLQAEDEGTEKEQSHVPPRVLQLPL